MPNRIRYIIVDDDDLFLDANSPVFEFNSGHGMLLVNLMMAYLPLLEFKTRIQIFDN